MTSNARCTFCELIRGGPPEMWVLNDDSALAFLDHHPLFHGHCLVIPREHRDTLLDLPASDIGTLFGTVQEVARAVQEAMGADGTFVAINNGVSQSVPHLHVHVVPRRNRDGLRGFFWPRQKYANEHEQAETVARIREALTRLRSQ